MFGLPERLASSEFVRMPREDLAVSDCSDPGASVRSKSDTVLRGFLVIVEALLVDIDETDEGECGSVSRAGESILKLSSGPVLL